VVYRMGNVKLYDHCKDKFLESSDFDPVIQKALSGDKSDRIEGYYKIGPVNGAKLARCLSKRHDFLRDKGRSVFIRNTLLVDLSLCPHLLKNELYVHRVLATDLKYDKKQIQELSLQHRVSGLVEEYQRIVLPFKVLTSPAQK
jgi:5'-3' exonuclease